MHTCILKWLYAIFVYLYAIIEIFMYAYIIFLKLAARTAERNLNDLRKENAHNRQK